MTDTTKLAEKAAKFLGLSKANTWEWNFRFHNFPWLISADDFFVDDFGPILAHLAKREMEKRGFGYSMETCGNPHTKTPVYRWWFAGRDGNHSDMAHENEYIALWLAIREAVKDE